MNTVCLIGKVKNKPEIILWRSRLENAVAMFDSEMKVYDFRIEKDGENKVNELGFHLLIPHKYSNMETELLTQLQNRMREYQQDMKLSIRFIKSFV